MAKRPTRTRTRPRALDIPAGHEGTMEVKRKGYGGVEEEAESIRVPAFIGPVGRVSVEGSVTRNMGDYNSIKVAVRVEMPCYPVPAEIDKCYDFCSALVDRKIIHELEVATAAPQDAAGEQAVQPQPSPGGTG